MQLDLTDICLSRHLGTAESCEANPSATSKEIVRLAIQERVRLAGSIGVTLDECASEWHVAPNQISGRFTELVKEGEIMKSGRRRPTRTGKGAAVYVAAGG